MKELSVKSPSGSYTLASNSDEWELSAAGVRDRVDPDKVKAIRETLPDVWAEFFVEKSGWVPVDIAGTIVHKPKDPNAFFGNSDGKFLAFHVDTDLQPAKGFGHAWAQYPLLQWSGAGDFWKEHRVTSKWDVTRQPVED